MLCDRLFSMSGSRVSVEGEDALVVAAVVAAGVGDVGEADAAESADGEVADGRVGVGLVPGPDALEVFGERRVWHVMRAVFDRPVPPGVDGQVVGGGQARGQAGDAVGDLFVLPGAAVGGAGVAASARSACLNSLVTSDRASCRSLGRSGREVRIDVRR